MGHGTEIESEIKIKFTILKFKGIRDALKIKYTNLTQII